MTGEPTELLRGDQEAPLIQLELERNRSAPALARAALVGFCRDRAVTAPMLATVTLLASEVVTNAVIHPDAKPTSGIRLLARLDGGLIRVEVTDQGSGFTPKPRAPAHGGGYGLYLLEKEARRWGVDRRQGTTVWFELATT